MKLLRKVIRSIRQCFCVHDYQTYWQGKFGNLLYKKRYFIEDKKVIICIKCKKRKP